MKTIHLFASSFLWSNLNKDSATKGQWVDEARHNGCTVVFHPSESDARAAAEAEISVSNLRDKHAHLVERISTALDNEASAQDDLRGCQRENERLTVENGRLTRLVADLHILTKP